MPNEILQSMLQFSNFLSQENKNKEAQLKDAKVNLAINKIGKVYQDLGPDATPDDIRQKTFGLMRDVTGLDVAQETVPIIQSSYKSALDFQEQKKTAAEDKAYAEGLNQLTRNQVDINGMGAKNAGNFVSTYLAGDYKFEQEDAAGTWLVKKDIKGKIIDKELIKNRQVEMQTELSVYAGKKAIDARYDKSKTDNQFEKMRTSPLSIEQNGMVFPLKEVPGVDGYFYTTPDGERHWDSGANAFKTSTTAGDETKRKMDNLKASIENASREFGTLVDKDNFKTSKEDWTTGFDRFIAVESSDKLGTKMSKKLDKFDQTTKNKAWDKLKQIKILKEQLKNVETGQDAGLTTGNVEAYKYKYGFQYKQQYDNVYNVIDNALGVVNKGSKVNPFENRWQDPSKPKLESGTYPPVTNFQIAEAFKKQVADIYTTLKKGNQLDIDAKEFYRLPKDPGNPKSGAIDFKDMNDDQWRTWWQNASDATKTYLMAQFRDSYIPQSVVNYFPTK